MPWVKMHDENHIFHAIAFFKNIFVVEKMKYMKMLIEVVPG